MAGGGTFSITTQPPKPLDETELAAILCLHRDRNLSVSGYEKLTQHLTATLDSTRLALSEAQRARDEFEALQRIYLHVLEDLARVLRFSVSELLGLGLSRGGPRRKNE